MFRFRKKLPVRYDWQGYIYFTGKMYRWLPEIQRRKVLNLCAEAGGEYHQALFECVTTNKSIEEVCMKHYLSPSTMDRLLRRYYILFAEMIKRS